MGFTVREIVTIIHGMVMGGLLLLGFPAVLIFFWLIRPDSLDADKQQWYFRIAIPLFGLLTVFAWLTVISGTYLPYPWYRAEPLAGADLARYPSAFLTAHPHLAFWEDYGMEWKEHLGWFAPLLLTAVFAILSQYRSRLLEQPNILRAVRIFISLAFVAAAISGLVGALVTKIAPVR